MHHHDAPDEKSSPVIWTVAIVFFIGMVGLWFGYQFGQGEQAGRKHPFHAPVAKSSYAEPDHKAIIEGLDDAMLRKGKAVFEANCALCHGADGNLGANNARKFGADEFKFGGDPYSMYVTVTKGNGAMAQVIKQDSDENVADAYAAVHYVREKFLKEANASQYVAVTPEYLAAGKWPAAGSGAAAGEGPTGAELAATPLAIPVEGLLAETAAATAARADSQAALASLAAARVALSKSKDVDPAVLATLKDISSSSQNGALARELTAAVQADDSAAFAALLSEPGNSTNAAAIALLSKAQVDQIFKSVQATLPAAEKGN